MADVPGNQLSEIPCMYFSICASRIPVYKVHYVGFVTVVNDNNQWILPNIIEQTIDENLANGLPVTVAAWNAQATSQQVNPDHESAESLTNSLNNTWGGPQNQSLAAGGNLLNYLVSEIDAPGGCTAPQMEDFFNPVMYAKIDGSSDTLYFAPNEEITSTRTVYSFDLPLPLSGVGPYEKGVHTLIANHIDAGAIGEFGITYEDIEDSPRDTGLQFATTGRSPEAGFSIFSSYYGGGQSSLDDGLVPSFDNANPFASNITNVSPTATRYFKLPINSYFAGSTTESILQNFATAPVNGYSLIAAALAPNQSFGNEYVSLDPIAFGKRIAPGALVGSPPPREDILVVPPPEITQGDTTIAEGDSTIISVTSSTTPTKDTDTKYSTLSTQKDIIKTKYTKK